MIIAGTLHSNERSIPDADLRSEPIWPNEEQLAYFELTLPAPNREQLLGQLTKGTTVEVESSTALLDAEAVEFSRDQKIERYLDTASTASCLWLFNTAKQPALESRVSGFSYASEPQLRPFHKSSPEMWEETKQSPTLADLIKEEVYETCTLQRLKGWEREGYEGEEMYGVVYEASGPNYKDGSGRQPCVMWVKFALPEGVAKQLWKDAWKDPTILREMSERYAKEHVLSEAGKAPGGDWDTYGRPPYDEWDARPNNMMAFRFNFDETPSNMPKSRILNIRPTQN